MNPDLNRVNADLSPNRDTTVEHGHNYTLSATDYPFRKLSNVDDRNSTLLHDTNDIAGSQGVSYRQFLYVVPGLAIDMSLFADDPDGFDVNSINVRRVTPRNGPSVINAVFNFRNFWDGRAQNDFNGVNSFGARDPYARVFQATSPNAQPVPVQISLPNSSLASQAMGPPISSIEMSADGRTWIDIGEKFSKPMRDSGKKLKPLRPLGKQLVHPGDSVLGPYSRSPSNGLTYTTYAELIHEAFNDKWWKSNWKVAINSDGSRTPCKPCGLFATTYEIEEMNFSLFFGIAVQLYEATLVSDDTPFDRYRRGDTNALTASQQQGLLLFLSQARGRCINCHAGPELTNASVSTVTATRFRRRNGNLIDMGFNNIGVRPGLEDPALGANDPFGKPLSEARLAVQGLFTGSHQHPASDRSDRCARGRRRVQSPRPSQRRAHGPLFPQRGDVDPAPSRRLLQPWRGLRPHHQLQRAADLATVATEPHRARASRPGELPIGAHRRTCAELRRPPSIIPRSPIPNGHPGSNTSVTPDVLEPGQAADSLLTIPAVGANGGAPLPLFPVP